MDWGWVLDGVNTTVLRNAGPACAEFLNPTWRKIETVFVLILAFWLIQWSYPKLSVSENIYLIKDRLGRRTLLILMCIIWGMEIGYKFSSRTVIYLLNPCHITTAIQIYLLAASPSKVVTAVFRLHLYWLNGPFLAYVFPETDTRIFPLESAVYWMQHGIMFVVPYYLLRLGGVFNVEDMYDMTWSAMSYGINLIYHFTFLQAVSVPTEVNLNHMLCPALVDPFESQLYRVAAVFHQAFLCPFLCKFYCLVAAFFLTKFKPTKVKQTLGCEVPALSSTNNTDLKNHPHKS